MIFSSGREHSDKRVGSIKGSGDISLLTLYRSVVDTDKGASLGGI